MRTTHIETSTRKVSTARLQAIPPTGSDRTVASMSRSKLMFDVQSHMQRGEPHATSKGRSKRGCFRPPFSLFPFLRISPQRAKHLNNSQGKLSAEVSLFMFLNFRKIRGVKKKTGKKGEEKHQHLERPEDSLGGEK